MILFIKHIDIEGPETLGRFFDQKGFEIGVINLDQGEAFPSSLKNLEAVISLGGPMNVYEEEKYPFLVEENIFIQKIVKEEIPFLGICLGAQVLAKACGIKVVRSPQEEIGFSNVRLTDAGQRDPLFEGIGAEFEVFQWHGDMCDVLDEKSLLASSNKCPYQGFKIGTNAYGLQFHIEITEKSIKEWSDAYIKDPVKCQKQKDAMLTDYLNKKDVFNQNAVLIYENFYKSMKSNLRSIV